MAQRFQSIDVLRERAEFNFAARNRVATRAETRAARKFFCADEIFLQKRVAQFQQLRTTNHQVTSVFTHFKFQLVNTRTFDQLKCDGAINRSYLGLVASFPWVKCDR